MRIQRFREPAIRKMHAPRLHPHVFGFLKALQIQRQTIIELHQEIIQELKMNIITMPAGMRPPPQELLLLNRQGVHF